jgi:hypothetical protein
MSKKKYELIVDFEQPSYKIRGMTITGLQPGERLKGKIVLTPNEDIKCRGVWVEVGFSCTGNGTPHEDLRINKMFHNGSLVKSQPVSYQLNYRIPNRGPMSYKGKIVEITWFIQVRVDIPLWFDDRKKFPFYVIPNMFKTRDEMEAIYDRKLSR